jgi:hypothetical protein
VNNDRLDQHAQIVNTHKEIIEDLQLKVMQMANLLATKDQDFARWVAEKQRQNQPAAPVAPPSAPFPPSPPQQSAPAPQQKVGLGGGLMSNFPIPQRTPQQIAQEEANMKAKKAQLAALMKARGAAGR